jgi:hypothetical protein
MTKNLIEDYLITVANQNPATARTIAVYFRHYDRFNNSNTDETVAALKAGKLDVYSHLNGFVASLIKKGPLKDRDLYLYCLISYYGIQANNSFTESEASIIYHIYEKIMKMDFQEALV